MNCLGRVSAGGERDAQFAQLKQQAQQAACVSFEKELLEFPEMMAMIEKARYDEWGGTPPNQEEHWAGKARDLLRKFHASGTVLDFAVWGSSKLYVCTFLLPSFCLSFSRPASAAKANVEFCCFKAVAPKLRNTYQ